MKPLLIVYVREGCHLCDAFLDEFKPLAQRLVLDYEPVDVDSSMLLAAKFGQRVPLLMANDTVICEYFLDPDKVTEYVQRVKVG